MAARRNINRYGFFFCLIMISGFILRLYNLDKKPFWWDECNTIFFVKVFWSGRHIMYYLKAFNSLLYIPLMFFWLKIISFTSFDNLEVIWRFPSLLAGIAGIFVLYKTTRELFDQKTALLSSFLLSFSVFHIWYSQEARPYTLVMLSVLLAVLCLIKWIKRDRTIYLFTMFFFICCSVSFHYIAILPFLLLIPFMWFYSSRRFAFKYTMLILIPVVFILILLIFSGISGKLISAVIHERKNIFWIMKPLGLSSVFTLENFQTGYNANSLLRLYADLVFWPLVFLSIFTAFKEKNKDIFFIAWISFSPPIFLWLFSFFIIPAYLDKYIIFCLPFYFILVSRGFFCISRNYLRYIILTNIVLILSLSLFYYYMGFMEPFKIARSSKNYMRHQGVNFLNRPFKDTISFIDNNAEVGDVIFFSNMVFATLKYYYSGDSMDNSTKNLKFYYSPSLINSRFSFYEMGNYFTARIKEINNKPAIPIYYVLLRKPSKSFSELSLRDKPQYALHLLDGDLEGIEYKRIWVLAPLWNGKTTDAASALIIKLLNKNKESHFNKKKSRKFGDILVLLFEKK